MNFKKNILKKVLVTSMVAGVVAFAPAVIVFAEDTVNTNAGTPATTSVTLTKEEREAKKEELKKQREAKRAEEKARREAAKAAEKAKREELRAQKEAFILKAVQDKFAKAVASAEAGIVAASAKLAEAKAAAMAATDRASFEKARKLFMEARKLLEKSIRPLFSTPKMENNENNILSGAGTTNTTGTTNQ